MKASTRPKFFPCSEVIGWILPRINVVKMILADVNGQGYAPYSLAYVGQACKLPIAEIYLTKKCLKELDLDIFDCIKKMMIHGKQFRTNPIGEYETMNLCTPYRIMDLMLNRIFGRANGKFYKIGWVPMIYFVATMGTIFKWANIVSHRLSSCINATLGGTS